MTTPDQPGSETESDMEVIDWNAPAEHRRLKALVYGKSGTGKTGFGVSAPNPLILLNERQAIPHIIGAARRLKRDIPPTIMMSCVEDYRDVVRAFHGDRAKTFRIMREDKVVYESVTWPDSVVLDSLTEACELIAAEIRDQSPPKIGKDGLPVDSERYWNVFQDRASKLIRSFRDVDLHVLFLCLLDDRTIGEGDDAHRWVGPQLSMRRLPGVVQAAVNVVGITSRRLGKDGNPIYLIKTQGPDYVETKPFPPLRKDEVMDFSSWVKRVNGVDDGSVIPDGTDQPIESSTEIKTAKAKKKTETKDSETVATSGETAQA